MFLLILKFHRLIHMPTIVLNEDYITVWTERHARNGFAFLNLKDSLCFVADTV